MNDVWQPIETAPTDGTHFIVYCEQTKRVTEVVPYIKRNKTGAIVHIEWIDWAANSLSNVNKWQPLPRPPK